MNCKFFVNKFKKLCHIAFLREIVYTEPSLS